MKKQIVERDPLSRPAVSHFPARPAGSAGSARRVPENGRCLRVLYVDDESLLRKLCGDVLVCAGYEVDTAGDGVEAWAMLQDKPYDLLITDNQMPRLTGLELIHQVRKARMTLAAILTSGSLPELSSADLPWPDCGAVLPKPFSPEQLLSAVGDVLQASNTARRGPAFRQSREEYSASVQPRRCWGIND